MKEAHKKEEVELSPCVFVFPFSVLQCHALARLVDMRVRATAHSLAL